MVNTKLKKQKTEILVKYTHRSKLLPMLYSLAAVFLRM
jgi:hypothetical protein